MWYFDEVYGVMVMVEYYIVVSTIALRLRFYLCPEVWCGGQTKKGWPLAWPRLWPETQNRHRQASP